MLQIKTNFFENLFRITETLTSRLNEEKEKHKQEIVQLKTEKAERIEHSSDKADFFRQEMERVANEAESGIAYYKVCIYQNLHERGLFILIILKYSVKNEYLFASEKKIFFLIAINFCLK